nr:ImmA/IrrE family metallo-endopeptidase [Granulicoccus phenolivorans]
MRAVPAVRTRDEHSVLGARVRWARNLRSRLAQDVAREAGLSVASLSRIEKADESFLSFEALSALSSALSVPMDWLTEEPRAYSSDQGTLFRANSKMTKRSQETVKTWKMLLAEMLATLDRSITLLPTTLVTRKGPVDPVEAATAVRDSMDLRSDEPVGHLMRSLESLGIFIGVHPFDEELHLRNHDASSGWYNLDTGRAVPIVLCREHSSWERTRFSVAHEAGHLAMHRHGSGADREAEATSFAAELLMPHEQLSREWPTRVTIHNLLPLKRRWGVSIAALIQQGYRHGLVSEDRRVSLFKQLSNGRDPATGQRWRIREPGADERQVERPLLIANALEVAYGTPPDLDALFSELPSTRDREWYSDFLPNFSCTWSRNLRNPTHRTPAVPPKADNVVSIIDYADLRRSQAHRE